MYSKYTTVEAQEGTIIPLHNHHQGNSVICGTQAEWRLAQGEYQGMNKEKILTSIFFCRALLSRNSSWVTLQASRASGQPNDRPGALFNRYSCLMLRTRGVLALRV